MIMIISLVACIEFTSAGALGNTWGPSTAGAGGVGISRIGGKGGGSKGGKGTLSRLGTVIGGTGLGGGASIFFGDTGTHSFSVFRCCCPLLTGNCIRSSDVLSWLDFVGNGTEF